MFILDDSAYRLYEHLLSQHGYATQLIHADLVHTVFQQSILRDMFFTLYFDEKQLYFTPNAAFHFPFKAVLFRQLLSSKSFKHLKLKSTGNAEASLFCAVTIFMFVVELFDEFLEQLPKNAPYKHFYSMFRYKNFELLYNESFKDIVEYPTEYATLQASVVRYFVKQFSEEKRWHNKLHEACKEGNLMYSSIYEMDIYR